MENKIREYVEKKLGGYSNTNKMIEFKEKLLSMMLDKYRECQSYGMTEGKSYSEAISVINNYSKEQKLYSAKATNDLASCRSLGGIA